MSNQIQNIDAEIQSNFKFYGDQRIVNVYNGNFFIQDPSFDEQYTEKFADLRSKKPKVLIELHGSPLHHFFSVYGNIFNAFKIFGKDITFVFNTQTLRPETTDARLLAFFYYFLQDQKIDYYLCDPSTHVAILVDNFYWAGESGDIPYPSPVNLIYNGLNTYSDHNSTQAYRKVYLSRKKVKNPMCDEDVLDASDSGLEFLRVDDEALLENFFASLGFSVVYPEDFKTFQEQISFFDEVKTLVSLSGGGSLNTMLMRPGGNVLEITTNLVTPDSARRWVSTRHNFFTEASFQKDHFYMSVPNKNKSAKEVIDLITKNKAVMELLNEEN